MNQDAPGYCATCGNEIEETCPTTGRPRMIEPPSCGDCDVEFCSAACQREHDAECAPAPREARPLDRLFARA